MPRSEVLWCTGLELKVVYHVAAPLRSTGPAEQAARGGEE